MRMGMTRSAVVAVCIFLVPAACTSTTTATEFSNDNLTTLDATSSSDSDSDIDTLGSPTPPFTFGDGSFRAEPPHPGEQPSVSSDDAYKSYRALGHGDVAADNGLTPTFTLARVTARAFGRMESDGLKLEIADRLVWIIRIAPLTCSSEGSGPRTKPDKDAAISYQCQVVIVVDANSGEPLFSASDGLESWPTNVPLATH